MDYILTLFIPFLGTSLGSAMVFLVKDKLDDRIQKAMLGFASGVMVAASCWSLIIPSLDMSEGMGKLAFIPAAVGLLLGFVFLLLLDYIIPHLHLNTNQPEGMPAKKLSNTMMLLLAVTLHNIPEGMAVGVIFASFLNGNSLITFASVFALCIGIAIQNVPEGAIISVPLKNEGNGKFKSFFYGSMSGIVEPIAAIITIWLIRLIEPLLPYFLAFAAGAMLYVVVEELIPEASEGEHSNVATIGFALGFVIMMILDVALG
ncbi:MAG: ZIP family metal transporter [Erysipelotrichaceae bacterium]|nr:ZIP family metal transporter [Erysipelotrichaceae bacterium]MDY5252362.1 ZIP family metal transporter [Erysipelotrichaceae bacterium]